MSDRIPDDAVPRDADGERIDALVEREIELARRRAELDAEFAEHYADVVDFCHEAPGDRMGAESDARYRSMAVELGLATRVSDRTILVRFDGAVTLRDFYPRALAALRSGRIASGHAQVIAAAGAPLIGDDERRERYERLVLPHAYERTPGRLKPIAERLVAELDPEGAAAAHEAERRRRDVKVRDVGAGMSELVAALPSVMAHAIHDRLTRLARANLRERRERAAAAAEPIPYEGAFGRAVHDPELLDDADRARALDAAGSGCGARADRARPDEARSDEARPDEARPDGAEPCCGDPGCAGRRAGAEADGQTANAAPLDVDPLDVDPLDDRIFGEVRADALVELLLAGRVDDVSRHAAINSIQARVAITVPALTAIGVDDAPAMLDGVGPIPLDTALQLCAGASQWVRVLTGPVNGAPLAADTYRPGAELRRFLEVRDGTCRMPGCGRPARFCDADHTEAWAEGGRTVDGNTAMLCRYHHTIKHARWKLEQRACGVLIWTSPSGRSYTERPAPIARPWTGPPGGRPTDASAPPDNGAPPGGNQPPGESTPPGTAGPGRRTRPEFRPTPRDNGDDPPPF